MRLNYALGNFGNGSSVVAFASAAKRDEFVAWGEKQADLRDKITAKDAYKRLGIKTYPVAIVIQETGERVYICR